MANLIETELDWIFCLAFYTEFIGKKMFMIQEVKSISNIAYAMLSQLHKLFIQMNLAEICSIVCYLSNIILSFIPGGL